LSVCAGMGRLIRPIRQLERNEAIPHASVGV
jgi:hypothetical protein